MPGGDGTGPMGKGPQTGRVAGYCSGYDVAGYMSAGRGFGCGRGRGMRMEFGMGGGRMPVGAQRSFMQTDELTTLKQQETALNGALEGNRKRIEALEKTGN